jgi:hypothetical protein
METIRRGSAKRISSSPGVSPPGKRRENTLLDCALSPHNTFVNFAEKIIPRLSIAGVAAARRAAGQILVVTTAFLTCSMHGHVTYLAARAIWETLSWLD